MSDIFTTIQDSLSDRTSVRSLAGLLAAVTIAVLAGLRALKWLLASLDTSGRPVPQSTEALVVSVVLPLAWLIVTISWLFWRSVPTVRGHGAGILFTASADSEVQALVSRLDAAITKQVADHGLNRLVRTYRVPTNRAVTTVEEARRALQLAGARLIVWGEVASGTIAGTRVSGFKRINFTMRHKYLRPDEQAGLRSALTPAVVDRQWLFTESETLLGLDVVAGNVAEVGTFSLALALAIDGDLVGAVRLLAPLHQNALAAPPARRRTQQFQRFSGAVRDLLFGVRYQQLIDLYHRELVDRILDRSADGAACKCQALADECAALSTLPGSFDLARSTIAFHFGRIEDAQVWAESARRCLPSDPAPLLSAAFLALWRREYSRVPQLYRKAEQRGPFVVELRVQILRFVQAVRERCPERHELLFALAVINQHFDSGLARLDFEAFLDATSSQPDLEPLRADATRRLAAL